MKKLFTQKAISLISLFCIVFGLMGMAIDTEFFAKIFVFGITAVPLTITVTRIGLGCNFGDSPGHLGLRPSGLVFQTD